ncbi:MAG: hypothetical protein QG607_107 [Patescibacteria group bacterium]|nr:hypothetical protein [Patescibacteria group bacterium]
MKFHEVSKNDVRIIEQEHIEAREPYEIQEVHEMLDSMDAVIKKFYPSAFRLFDPPTLDRIEGNLVFIQQALLQDFSKMTGFDRSYLAAAAVRYVDNFIDEVLWPIFEGEMRHKRVMSEETSRNYQDFIKKVYDIVLRYDPYLPEEIIQIPLLEFKLMSHPDQKTFDETVSDYFFYKSFNLAYIEHLLKRERPAESALWSEKDKNRFLLLAAWDVSRDMVNWGEKTDFDVFKHVSTHHINARVLIDFLQNIITNNNDCSSDFDKRAVMDCKNMIEYLESDFSLKEEI